MLLTREEALQTLGLEVGCVPNPRDGAVPREEALPAVGLEAASQVDDAAVQRAFERLARRYPQSHFPERFHRLLAARDALLDTGRQWREQLESRTLDLQWLLPHLPESPPTSREVLQKMLRAGFLAEPLLPPDPF